MPQFKLKSIEEVKQDQETPDKEAAKPQNTEESVPLALDKNAIKAVETANADEMPASQISRSEIAPEENSEIPNDGELNLNLSELKSDHEASDYEGYSVSKNE